MRPLFQCLKSFCEEKCTSGNKHENFWFKLPGGRFCSTEAKTIVMQRTSKETDCFITRGGLTQRLNEGPWGGQPAVPGVSHVCDLTMSGRAGLNDP